MWELVCAQLRTPPSTTASHLQHLQLLVSSSCRPIKVSTHLWRHAVRSLTLLNIDDLQLQVLSYTCVRQARTGGASRCSYGYMR
jgi:hypothetical protein